LNIIPTFLAAMQKRRRARRDARLLVQLLGVFLLIVLVSMMVFHYMMVLEGQDYSFGTGLYWVISTMTTLGLGDIVFVSTGGRIFTMIVLLIGILFIFVILPFTFIESVYSAWVEAANESMAPRSLSKKVHGHVIITGADPLSLSLIRKLDRYNYSYVLLAPDYEQALPLVDRGYNVMVGEPDNPDTYEQAQIEIASLVAVTGMSDSMNATVLMSIRQIDPDVPLISVAQSETAVEILTLAGATRVLQPIERLGRALARRAYGGDQRANVIASVDQLRIAEAKLTDTELQGRTLIESGIRAATGVTVLGFWERGQFHPATPQMLLGDNSLVVLAGTDEQLARFNSRYPIPTGEHTPVVIIGGGRVGQATGRALEEMGRDYRIIERSGRHQHRDEHIVIGDALRHETLTKAGLDDSSTVILTTHDDDINVYLTLYLRNYREDLVIISRSMHERNLATLQQAGADFVLSHSSLGANAIFNLLKRSNIEILAEGMEIIRMIAPPRLAGHSLAQSNLRAETGCILLAIQDERGMLANPDPQEPIPAGSEIILLATVEDEERFLAAYPQQHS
jgi:Trk K+ transport system NAD-binding subunit